MVQNFEKYIPWMSMVLSTLIVTSFKFRAFMLTSHAFLLRDLDLIVHM